MDDGFLARVVTWGVQQMGSRSLVLKIISALQDLSQPRGPMIPRCQLILHVKVY